MGHADAGGEVFIEGHVSLRSHSWCITNGIHPLNERFSPAGMGTQVPGLRFRLVPEPRFLPIQSRKRSVRTPADRTFVLLSLVPSDRLWMGPVQRFKLPKSTRFCHWPRTGNRLFPCANISFDRSPIWDVLIAVASSPAFGTGNGFELIMVN